VEPVPALQPRLASHAWVEPSGAAAAEEATEDWQRLQSTRMLRDLQQASPLPVDAAEKGPSPPPPPPPPGEDDDDLWTGGDGW
jgi:hypothetical protein